MNKHVLANLGLCIKTTVFICCSYCGRTPTWAYRPGEYGGQEHIRNGSPCGGVWEEHSNYESALQRSAAIIAARAVPAVPTAGNPTPVRA